MKLLTIYNQYRIFPNFRYYHILLFGLIQPQ